MPDYRDTAEINKALGQWFTAPSGRFAGRNGAGATQPSQSALPKPGQTNAIYKDLEFDDVAGGSASGAPSDFNTLGVGTHQRVPDYQSSAIPEGSPRGGFVGGSGSADSRGAGYGGEPAVGDRFNGGGVYMMGNSAVEDSMRTRDRWDRQAAAEKSMTLGKPGEALAFYGAQGRDAAAIQAAELGLAGHKFNAEASRSNNRDTINAGDRRALWKEAGDDRRMGMQSDIYGMREKAETDRENMRFGPGSDWSSAQRADTELKRAQIGTTGYEKKAKALDAYNKIGEQYKPGSPEHTQARRVWASMYPDEARMLIQSKAAGGIIEGYGRGKVVGKDGERILGAIPDMPSMPPLDSIHQQGATGQMLDPRLMEYIMAATKGGMTPDVDAYKRAKEQRMMQMAGNYMGMGQNVQLARGGAVPVQGQELMGVGPAAGGGTEDTIPAVIDGSQPAALSSGEFVVTAKATDSVGAPVLRAIMKGLEQGNPAVIQGLMQVAAKASAPQKPQQAVA